MQSKSKIKTCFGGNRHELRHLSIFPNWNTFVKVTNSQETDLILI